MYITRAKRFSFYIIIFILTIVVVFCACDGNGATRNTETDPPFIHKEDSANEPSDGFDETTTEYRIRLLLTCTVKGDNGQGKEINCTYGGKTQAEIDNENFTVKIGETFSDLIKKLRFGRVDYRRFL